MHASFVKYNLWFEDAKGRYPQENLGECSIICKLFLKKYGGVWGMDLGGSRLVPASHPYCHTNELSFSIEVG